MRFVLDSVIQEEPPLKKVVKAMKKPITRKTVLKNLRRKTSLKEPPEVTSEPGSKNMIYIIIFLMVFGTFIFILPHMIINSFSHARSHDRRHIFPTSQTSIVHVIPPLHNSQTRLLILASFLRARKFASSFGIRVTLVFNRFSSDEMDFDWLDHVQTNTLESCASKASNPVLHLPCIPFITDILHSAYLHPSDIAIFTSSDIGVYENFYAKIAEMMKQHTSVNIVQKELMINVRKNGMVYDANHLDEIYQLNATTAVKSRDESFVWRMDKYSEEDIDLDRMILIDKFWVGTLKYILGSKSEASLFHEESRTLTFHMGNMEAVSDQSDHRNQICWNAIAQARVIDRVTKRFPLLAKLRPDHYKRVTKKMYGYAKKFQCDTFSAIWDDFSDLLDSPVGWMVNELNDDSARCEWCEKKQKPQCVAPPWSTLETIPRSIPWHPCKGGNCAMTPESGFQSFSEAWRACGIFDDCRVILKDSKGSYRLRQRAAKLHWFDPPNKHGFSFAYYDCFQKQFPSPKNLPPKEKYDKAKRKIPSQKYEAALERMKRHTFQRLPATKSSSTKAPRSHISSIKAFSSKYEPGLGISIHSKRPVKEPSPSGKYQNLLKKIRKTPTSKSKSPFMKD